MDDEERKDLQECLMNAESVLKDLEWLTGRDGYHFEIVASKTSLEGLVKRLKEELRNAAT